ncbi:hypothetical protein K469DRAFT_625080 [Zopfia rhizophila CBS 207.26]|uniref:Methyltransferase domain-containing protein n=1 Tax=Zopfia rhizophila CBS 207.26 TaxID=1314779 RepID=A0A6A6EH53_9PEZI|nr:hypothetical protein K469DRAFT_625080 [Zopfia rhizophila CBS 207.26]
MPPSFGSPQYWNNRFTSNPNPFEWLEPPNALDFHLVSALNESQDQNPQILHIGCGTSLLSFHLRAHVNHSKQIHNVDYSDVAIEIGKKRELEIFGPDHILQYQENKHMRWSVVDLLSHTSLHFVCKPSSYSIIVDKSTSDSIACADDVYVTLPYPLSTSSPHAPFMSALSQSSEPIHPLHILAIHLAFLTKPGGRWISLSYSQDRFPFLHLPPIPSLPDPGKLWWLESKYEIEVPEVTAKGRGGTAVHRPKVLHWVYVILRTDVALSARDGLASAYLE